MIEHADMLQFEQAAAIRDEIEALKKNMETRTKNEPGLQNVDNFF